MREGAKVEITVQARVRGTFSGEGIVSGCMGTEKGQ
jgi:hypothetical protein